MAKIYYDVWDKTEDNPTSKQYETKQAAMKAARKKNHTWERMFLTDPTDYLDPDKHAGELFAEGDMVVFINNEQNTYSLCPWGGRTKLVASDEKYEMYHTTNFEHTGKEGFYLVDNNSRLK